MSGRRLTAFGVAGAIAVLGVVLPAQTASAAVDPATPDVVTTDALPTWQINGVVYSQAIVGNTVYVTGSFTKARPPGVAAGGAGEVDALNIFAYDLTTGNRVASFNHSLNAQGLVIKASPDKTRLYVGGDFSAVDGVARGKVAAFTVATGALVSGGGYVPPNVGGQVRGLGVTGSTVYVGGNFLSANGVSRTRLAAFQNSNGAMLPWAPKAENGYVWTMTMSPDNSKVIPGGSFTTLNGVPAMGMGAIDSATGATLPWAATSKIHAGGSQAAITALKTDGQRIYGGAYAFVLGQENFANFEGTFGLNPDTGAIEFVNDCLGDTYDVAPIKNLLYMVSHYHDCTAVDSIPDTNPRARWQKAAVTYNYPTDLTTRNDVYGWNYQGYQYARMLHWWPDLSFGTYTSAQQAAWTVDAVGDYVVMGGEFPRVNGALQQGLVRMKTKATAPKLRGPRYTTVPATPTPSTNAVSLTAGTVRVSWGSAWDQEDKNLKYEVLRNNNTFVHTTTGDSEFWDLPTKGFVDTGLTPGSSVRYQVRITDSDGNILWSPVSNTVTVGSGSPSAYAQTVIDDGASHLWRLGEGSGSSIDWAGFDDLAMSGGYTRGAAGSIIGDSDKATSFGGSDGLGATTSQIVGPDVFTLETWFKTTTTSGGKLIGFGNANTGTSSNYDRHIYMEPDGRITFGIYHDGFFTTTSPTALNDGQWHQVVGTMGPSGLTLYVDGRKTGSNGGTSVAQAYSGYWRIGGDSPWSGNAYFAGDIDDVAIYPAVLPLSKVQSHYIASGRTLNVPTRPSDAYGQAVWDADPDLYWRLGDTTDTAKDAGPAESDGQYNGGYAQGQSGAFDGATNKAVAFNGSDGFVASKRVYSNPHNYTLEAWVKTTSTNGGKVIGFGCSNTGTSGCYDRHVYFNNDGTLTFGVWTGFTNTITTPLAYNDGQWHHVMATQSNTDGMALYVDGVLRGTNGQNDAQAYDGYWRVGGDNHWGCCSPFLAGTIDEVAVYSSVLPASAAAQHFQLGGGNVANQPPMAAFTHTENDLALSVNGSSSSDADGSIIGYSWNWGDGTPVGSGATATHTYAAAGTYTVTLMVTDNDGDTDTEAIPVTVTAPPPNQLPMAAFTHTETFLTTSVNGSTSTDPDGTIVTYAWNWGDASPAGVGATANHTYAAAGTYTVTLTVTDDDGAIDTETSDVTVVENQAPTAAFTHTETNLAMSVNGSTSSDPDGTIASYSWNWGDATANGTGATANHTYATAGTYTVTLTVTDNGGKTDTETASVTVTGPPNQLPTAAFTHTENALQTSVNGSTSSDPDGTIASYSWNWGDLTANGTGATANHTYAAAGTYTVTLTVTDNQGGTDTETASVTVAAATVFARDDFGRTVASGWGTADVGGPWTLGGLASRWSVSAGTGKVSLNAGDGFNGYLPSISSTSTEAKVLITTDKVPTGGGQYVSVIGRRVSSTVDYRAKVRMAAGGAVAVWLTRNSSGTETVLTSATLAGVNYGAGDALRVRLQVTGTAPTTVRVKVWKNGTAEPAAWSLTSTDNTAGFQAAGSAGLYPYVSGTSTNGPVVYSFDEWWVGPPQP
ncbi:PKD repeat-containing protein [Pedococcus dokdonensis]|uniref:PKD repeat-containing protein n=1 Tax=Pedococcus dokdonensis TaxID=443156 RepID=A0A1H0S8P2_9MICO|nr:PKD domain-containing protein [Pedococcus dokdonensis]SDP38037.1 PKD repeat-containing protein [Pedococcus dokdonensis]